MGMLLMPGAVFAQAEDTLVPVAEPAPVVSVPEAAPVAETESAPATVPEISTEPAESVPDSNTAVQDTANTQEMIEGDVLEDTANPETQSDNELVVSEIVEATSTEEIIEVVPDPVASETPVEEVTIEEPVLDVVAESLPVEPAPEPVRMDTEAAEVIELKVDVDPSYVVSLSGKTIPAKKKGLIGTSDLTAPVATQVDSQTGVLTVSGSCASPYYVVLIFKNQTDYEVDPRSFIVNRAYPCENGSYEYSIDRLPPTLPNGTYYLLIGEQGERGAWTPATGLTEISINRSN